MAATAITPLHLPKRVRTLVVFGGTFDPPHRYHVDGPLSVSERLFGSRGWVLYVPAARSPLKKGAIASDEERFAMLWLALIDSENCGIWTDELDRAGRGPWTKPPRRAPGRGTPSAARGTARPSYTVDTLRRLRRVAPPRVTLRLLIGADQAAAFHKWKRAREVIRLAEPLVMAREPVTTVAHLYDSLDASFWTREERAAWCGRMAPNEPLAPSSTALRAALPGAPADPAEWASRPPLDMVTPPVAQYIVERGLYGRRT